MDTTTIESWKNDSSYSGRLGIGGFELQARFININNYSEGYLDIATACNIGCLDIVVTCIIVPILLDSGEISRKNKCWERGLLEARDLYNSVVNWNFLDRYDKQMWLEFKEFNEGSPEA
nr:UvrD-like helicase, ATP-binding domain, P-loop containing nucleoside triphosphate hydrolase [Tanacetum cinerariifolium]